MKPVMGIALVFLGKPTLEILLIGATIVVVACIVFMLCWVNARKQYRTALLVASLSQVVAQTQLEYRAFYNAIASYIAKFLQDATLVIQLEPNETHQTSLMITEGGVITEIGQQAEIGMAPYEWLKAERRPLFIPDFKRSPVPPLQLGRPHRSAAYLPLVVSGRFLGAILVQSERRHAFGHTLQRMLTMAADQVALGLDTARMYQREKKRSALLLMIAEVGRKVAAILDLDTLFADTVRLVQETLGYYHVSIFSVDTEAQRIELKASSSPVIQARGIEVPWGKGLIGNAALGQVILANDVRKDPRFLPHAALERTASELALPLRVEDRVLGVLDLQSDRYNAFGEDEISALQILADQIAVAIEDSRIYRAEQEQAWISTALLQVAEALAKETTIEGIAFTAARLATLLMGLEHCRVLIYEPEMGTFSLPTPHDGPSVSLGKHTYTAEDVPLLRLVHPDQPLILAPWATLGALIVEDLVSQSTNARAVGLPLSLRGELMGVLVGVLTDEKDLSTPQRTVLEGIARQTSLALDAAQLLMAQQEEAWVSAALLQVATIIASGTHDLQEIATAIVRVTPMLVGVSWCALFVRDPDGERYVGVSSYGLEPNLQEIAPPLAYALEDSPWFAEAQNAEHAFPLDGAVMESWGLVPSHDPLGSALVFPLRAHQHEYGLLIVGMPTTTQAFSGRRMMLLEGIARQTALAIAAARLYEQAVRRERLEHEMRLAREIQKGFLPEVCPSIPGWRLAVDWRSASGVSGDFYDFVLLSPQKLAVTVADVSDKGVAAALYMALSRTVLRAAALGPYSPAETLARANRVLLEESRSGMFVTLVYGIFDLESGVFTFVRAGHMPPIWVHAKDRELTPLEPKGVVLGVIEEPELEEMSIALSPGDAIVLYTDGVTEALGEQGQEFGIERLQEAIHQAPSLDPETLIAHINAAVHAFVGEHPQSDDYTLLVVQREPQG